jgi:hypothetical protein
MFYKLLIEHSASFSGKLMASRGALEFVEPDARGVLVPNLELAYEEDELQRFTKLVGTVWQHIMSLNFPDVSGYSPNVKGLLKFEQDLIDGNI